MNDKKRFSSTTLLTGTALLLGLMMTQSASAQTIDTNYTFWNNPGNLTMKQYVPSGVSSTAPIVVAMHGCQQTASEYVTETGLKALADSKKFYLIIPEQTILNHLSGCFNWFQSGDAMRGQGEAASIANMVSHFRTSYPSAGASNKVFLSGFSAGGGMAAVMLAAYGDLFQGAVIHAGIPYRCATTVLNSFPCMGAAGYTPVDKSASQWKTLLNQSGYSGTRAAHRLALFTATSDTTVHPSRAVELEQQWSGVVANANQLKQHSSGGIGHKVSVSGSGSGCGPGSGTYVSASGTGCAQDKGLGPVALGGIGVY